MVASESSEDVSLQIFKRALFLSDYLWDSEAVFPRCSVKKVFLEISQNSWEKTCIRVSFLKETLAQVFFCEFYEISKNTFFHRTPLVATYGDLTYHFLSFFINRSSRLRYSVKKSLRISQYSQENTCAGIAF